MKPRSTCLNISTHAHVFNKYDCQMACFPDMQSTLQIHREKIRDKREKQGEVMAGLPLGSTTGKRVLEKRLTINNSW